MNTIAKANALVSQGGAADAIYLNNCLDEILKQLTRSRQSIDLFYSLYIKMLDRLFGEDVSRTEVTATGVQGVPPWIKGVSGGWLRLLMNGAPMSGLAHGAHRVSSFQSQIQSQIQNQNMQGMGLRRDPPEYLSSLHPPCDALLSKFLPGSGMFAVLAKIQGMCIYLYLYIYTYTLSLLSLPYPLLPPLSFPHSPILPSTHPLTHKAGTRLN
jgi:hypothetical protein